MKGYDCFLSDFKMPAQASYENYILESEPPAGILKNKIMY
jgi:hypothetical protein